MDLLFVTRWTPDENGGGTQQRAAASLRALASCGRVHLLCLNPDARSMPRSVHDLVASCTLVADLPGQRDPATRWDAPGSLVQRLFRSAWSMSGLIRVISRQQARDLSACLPLSRFDGVFAFHLGSACVVDRLDVQVPAARRVVDWDFLESPNIIPYARLTHPSLPLRKRLAALFNRAKVWRWESAVLQRWDSHLCSSTTDVAYLQGRAGPHARVTAINNSAPVPAQTPPFPDNRPPTVIFVGTMAYQPNLDAVRHFIADIWPTVRLQMPAANLIVVGRAMPESLLQLDGHDGITITPNAPDLFAQYQLAHVAIVPLRFVVGSNLKIPEALAHGRPVVGYGSACARHGLTEEDGVFAVDDPAELAATLLRLLGNLHETARLGAHAHQAALRKFSRTAIDAALVHTLKGTFMQP